MEGVDETRQETIPENILPPVTGPSGFSSKGRGWRVGSAWLIGGILLLILMCAILLSQKVTKVASPQAPSTGLIGTAWQVESVLGQATVATPNGTPYLQFDTKKSFSGRDTCGNSLQGEYQLDGQQLMFNGVVSAYMACDELVRWTPALRGTTSMLVQGNRLTLLGSNGAVTMKLIQMDLVGSPTQVQATSTRSPSLAESALESPPTAVANPSRTNS
jgi:heat shock protein HslJ